MAGIGFGTLLKMGNAATPEVFATIGKVRSIGGPDKSANFVDITHMESTGGYEEFVFGLKTAGSLKVEMLFESSPYATLNTLFNAGTLKNWQVAVPADVAVPSNAVTISFAGYIESISAAFPVKDVKTMNVNIKITGNVTTA